MFKLYAARLYMDPSEPKRLPDVRTTGGQGWHVVQIYAPDPPAGGIWLAGESQDCRDVARRIPISDWWGIWLTLNNLNEIWYYGTDASDYIDIVCEQEL